MKTHYGPSIKPLSYVVRSAVAIAQEHDEMLLLRYRGISVLVTPQSTEEEIAELWEQDSRCEGKGN